jgi:hypothetical protein
VTVKLASGRALHNHASVSVGFMSSSDKRVHFGLGQEAKIATVTIRWPSGTVQVLKDVAADQILKLKEPAEEVVRRTHLSALQVRSKSAANWPHKGVIFSHWAF